MPHEESKIEVFSPLVRPEDPDRVELGDVREDLTVEPPQIYVPKRSECDGEVLLGRESGPLEPYFPRDLQGPAIKAAPGDVEPGGKYSDPESWEVVGQDYGGARVLVRSKVAPEINHTNLWRTAPPKRRTAEQLRTTTDLLARKDQPFYDLWSELTEDERVELLLAGQDQMHADGRQFNVSRTDADRLGVPYTERDRFLEDLSDEQVAVFSTGDPELREHVMRARAQAEDPTLP